MRGGRECLNTPLKNPPLATPTSTGRREKRAPGRMRPGYMRMGVGRFIEVVECMAEVEGF